MEPRPDVDTYHIFGEWDLNPQVQDLRADVVPRDESVPVYAHPPRPILILTAVWNPRTGTF